MKRSPLKPKRATPRRSSRVRDVDYMLRVKALPCSLLYAGDHVCEGVIEADHVGPRGLGQKSNDRDTIPLCTRGHRERTDFSGYFRGFDQAKMRLWCQRKLEVTRALLSMPPR